MQTKFAQKFSSSINQTLSFIQKLSSDHHDYLFSGFNTSASSVPLPLQLLLSFTVQDLVCLSFNCRQTNNGSQSFPLGDDWIYLELLGRMQPKLGQELNDSRYEVEHVSTDDDSTTWKIVDKIGGNVSTLTTSDVSLYNCVRTENRNLFSFARKVEANKISVSLLSLNELALICYKLSKGARVELIGKKEARHILKDYYEEFSDTKKVSILVKDKRTKSTSQQLRYKIKNRYNIKYF